MVDGLATFPGGFDDDLKMFGQLTLAHELGQSVWAEAGFVHFLGRSRGGVHDAHFRPVGNAGSPAVLCGDSIAVLGVTIQNAGEHLASGIWCQRDLANSRSAVRTIISTDPSSGAASSACRISSVPYPSSSLFSHAALPPTSGMRENRCETTDTADWPAAYVRTPELRADQSRVRGPDD